MIVCWLTLQILAASPVVKHGFHSAGLSLEQAPQQKRDESTGTSLDENPGQRHWPAGCMTHHQRRPYRGSNRVACERTRRPCPAALTSGIPILPELSRGPIVSILRNRSTGVCRVDCAVNHDPPILPLSADIRRSPLSDRQQRCHWSSMSRHGRRKSPSKPIWGEHDFLSVSGTWRLVVLHDVTPGIRPSPAEKRRTTSDRASARRGLQV